MSPKCVPKDSIGNKSILVQVMAWCRSGVKPLSEPNLTQCTDAYMSHDLNVLTISQHEICYRFGNIK